jgi:hypothetical protein
LRRARARRDHTAGPSRTHGIHSIVLPESPSADIRNVRDEFSARIVHAEGDDSELRTTPAHVRRSLNLNRRSEVLRLNAAGQPTAAIAEYLGLPGGEVEFILKIDRMLASAVQTG